MELIFYNLYKFQKYLNKLELYKKINKFNSKKFKNNKKEKNNNEYTFLYTLYIFTKDNSLWNYVWLNPL